MRRLVVTMVILTVTTSACARASTARPRQAKPAAAPQATSATIYLDSPLNTESFETPVEAQPAMTSDEAIAAFQKVDSEFVLVPDATVQLGLYSAAVGDGTYRYERQLAWAISWHMCAVSMHEPPPGTELPCTFWLFLDANTGEMLEGEWQQGS
jgi:hypothetical protein